jgi:hypothetical protein
MGMLTNRQLFEMLFIHGKDGVSGSSPEVGSSVSKGSPVIFGTLFLFVCHMTVCTI